MPFGNLGFAQRVRPDGISNAFEEGTSLPKGGNTPGVYTRGGGKGNLCYPRLEKKKILNIPVLVPKTLQQICEFLGSAGFCRLWVPGFTKIANPLEDRRVP